MVLSVAAASLLCDYGATDGDGDSIGVEVGAVGPAQREDFPDPDAGPQHHVEDLDKVVGAAWAA